MAPSTAIRRRRFVRTLGSLAAASFAASIGASGAPPETVPADADCYVAVVDRIVDGDHVVLLLEENGELVDQHVEPASEMDDVEESDILHVVIKDDEVLAYRHLEERPDEPAEPESDTRF